MCIHQPPRSQDGEKLGGGLGTRQHIRLGAQVSEIWRVIEARTLLHGLGEVDQLLHEVSQLFYEVHLPTASGRRAQVGKYIKPLIFHP